MTAATPGNLGLTDTELAHARGIVAAVRARGWAEKAAVIAVEVALTESGLKMYANGNNPESMLLPHDAVGWDHGSVGLFQQQVGGAMNSTANWGTTAQLMDAETSAAKFLDALAHQDWEHLENWVAAQNVQRSAYDGSARPANNFTAGYGANYWRNDARAQAIVSALWEDEDTAMQMTDAEISALVSKVAAATADAVWAQLLERKLPDGRVYKRSAEQRLIDAELCARAAATQTTPHPAAPAAGGKS